MPLRLRERGASPLPMSGKPIAATTGDIGMGVGFRIRIAAAMRAMALPVLMIFFLVLSFRSGVSSGRRHITGGGVGRLLAALDSKKERVVSESVTWTGYARVYSRTVAYSDGRRNVSFDVWGRTWRGGTFGVAIAVPFDRRTRTFTLVREFCVAHSRFVYSFPAGQVEAKHSDEHEAAEAELAEEARLECNTELTKLISAPAPQDKFQRERVVYYLCTDVKKLANPPKRDKEELIDVIQGITASELLGLVQAGVLQSNMIAAAMLALRELEERRFL